jgi:hypothetical protein
MAYFKDISQVIEFKGVEVEIFDDHLLVNWGKKYRIYGAARLLRLRQYIDTGKIDDQFMLIN